MVQNFIYNLYTSYHIIAQFIIYIKEKRKVMFQSIYNNNIWLGITNDEGLVLVSILY